MGHHMGSDSSVRKSLTHIIHQHDGPLSKNLRSVRCKQSHSSLQDARQLRFQCWPIALTSYELIPSLQR